MFDLSASSSSSSSSSSESEKEETEEAKAARVEFEEKKRKYDEKTKRNTEKEMSNVILDIKPEDETTDLEAVYEQIKATIVKDGLTWGAHELMPLVYGLKKLRVCTTIVNVKVSTDDMEEEIQAIPGVGSTAIVTFQKI